MVRAVDKADAMLTLLSAL